MNGARERFPASCRIQERRDFLRIERQGRRAAGAHFVVFAQARGAEVRRLGVTVSKRVGGSVVRSRVKRLVREAFRRNRAALPSGDTVVIARTGAGELTYLQVCEELTRLWARCSPSSIS